MARKLKVYRTPVGFHDAYVAAPSQKAALEAWGSDADLFGRGAAELVIDEELTREPLENPGKVIRRLRGSDEDHFEALEKQRPPTRKKRVEAADETAASTSGSSRAGKPEPKPKPKPKPKPSRQQLDGAEAALEKAKIEQETQIAELRQQEEELAKQRHALEQRHERNLGKLQTSLDKARDRYEAALERWRD